MTFWLFSDTPHFMGCWGQTVAYIMMGCEEGIGRVDTHW